MKHDLTITCNGETFKIDDELFDKKFEEIPKDILKKASKVILDNLSETDKKYIIEQFGIYGKMDWMHSIPRGHFSVGMSIRNLLRDNGLLDDCLPDKNWDDYYIQVIEHALHLR